MINATVESIVFGSDGVLHHQGLVIFVPFTAPQDEVCVILTSTKRRFAQGKSHKARHYYLHLLHA